MAEHLQPEVVQRSAPTGPKPPPRLEALAGAWLAGYRSASTRRAYRQDLKTWLTFCAAHDLNPLSVRRSHIELFARSQEHDGLAPATVARRLTALSSWYGWLVDEEYTQANPVARVHRPHVSQESGRSWLGRLELADWLQSAEQTGGMDYALACLLAINALRIGEICAANIHDLAADRHHRTLRIIGKGARPAVVPLTARTAFAVDQAIGDRRTGPLLLTRSGNRLNREAAARAVTRICTRAHITKPLTPHGLRHSAITAALNAGVDLRDVQQFARHADPATTIRYDRARLTLDRHPAYVVDVHIAGGTS